MGSLQVAAGEREGGRVMKRWELKWKAAMVDALQLQRAEVRAEGRVGVADRDNAGLGLAM